MNSFTLEEAIALIYRHAVLKVNLTTPDKKPELTMIGHVCGLLTLNDQIEVVIKFHDDLRQFTKEEFESEIMLIGN